MLLPQPRTSAEKPLISIFVFRLSAKVGMEDYSRSYGGGGMQMERYYGQPQPRPPAFNYLRSYSASAASAQTQVSNKDLKLKLKKGKSTSASSSSSWSFSDPDFQRKRRVASYKMYSVEGKMKGSFRKSFRWFKNKYTQMVYGWW